MAEAGLVAAAAFATPADAAPAGTAAPAVRVFPARYAGAEPYAWDGVFIGSGGTVTQFAQHPKSPKVLYMGADVGAPFRRTLAGDRWVPLGDHFGPDEIAMYHTECIALDPGNPDAVFYSAGKEWTSGTPGILKSTDRGSTWKKVVLTGSDGKPVFITNGRTGRRLWVDPNDSKAMYYGSRRDGLFHSPDAGESWAPVSNFPAPGTDPKDVSVPLILIDGRGGRSVVYAWAASANKDKPLPTAGMYRSEDGGKTWAPVPGAPSPGYGAIDEKTGAVYVAGGKGVFKYAGGAWEDITPTAARGQGFSAVAVSPHDPNLLAAARAHCGWGNAVFRSTDGGKTWAEFNDADFNRGKKTSYSARLQPWEQGTNGEGAHAYACVSTLTFDRANPRKLWMTSWPGIWSAADFTAERIGWRAEVEGHEETCLFDVVSPPVGPPLVSGQMDVGGFRHASLKAMPAHNFVGMGGPFNNTPEDVSDLDFCEARPTFLVAAAGWKHNNTGTAGFSTDGGETWQNFPAKPFPDAKNGRIAVSATDPDVIVWVPRDTVQGGTPAYFTRDRGRTWAPSQGAPLGMVYGEFVYTFYQPLEADRVRPDTFYLYDRRDGRFFRSEDGGATFRHAATLPGQSGVHFDQHTVRAAPGIGGEVWAALDDKGLFRSSDGGATWAKLGGVERAWRFGWGAAPKGGKPIAFLLGRLDGDAAVGPKQVAVYRSDDLGATWKRLSDPKRHGWGQASVVNGDRQNPGRVYVGTNGRGIFFGEPGAAAKPGKLASGR